MDVTCKRCNTEYEFEEALVSSRGTTVKCTHCGHLFKVQRAARVALPASTSHWTVRQANGRAIELADLSELPRAIAEGEFGRDDELSRTGQVWRRLGDIEELDAHFVAADRRGPSRVRAQLQPIERASARPAPREQTPPAAEPVAAAELPTLRKPLVQAPPAPPKIDQAAEAVRNRGLRHESRHQPWVRLLTSAAIVVAIAVWFFSLPPTGEHFSRAQNEPAADPSARFLAAAERALAAYRLETFDPALVEYIKALAFHEHDAHILSRVSRVHALWAEELRTQGELSRHAAVAAPAAVLETQQREAQTHVQRAKHYAELALQSVPDHPEALLAHSDALRLLGDLSGARAALDRALTHAAGSAEALRISALLKLREAGEGPASELAAQAVAADPHQLVTRVLLARLLLVQGNVEGVRAQLQALRSLDPEHPEAARLEELLAGQQAPAAQASAELDGMKAPASPEAESFIERGRSMLEAGQTAGAKRMFEHALTLQPDLVPAHAGLGQVALARGRPVQAIDHFVAAALGGDGESLIALADLYRRLGRQREALTAYQSYLQQNPHGPQLDLAKTQIERLGEQFASARKP